MKRAESKGDTKLQRDTDVESYGDAPKPIVMHNHGRIVSAIIGVIAACVLTIGMLVAVAPSADAGPWCRITGNCGQVTNLPGSDKSVLIGDQWSPFCRSKDADKGWCPPPGHTKKLKPGQTSTRYYHDTDAVRVPAKCRIRVGKPLARGKATRVTWWSGGKHGKWHKIRDYVHLRVTVFC